MNTPAGWLVDGADLLAEPDPGPTPWLVEGLIPDGSLGAVVGRWKTTKSYGTLDLCRAIATGRPAFGRLAVLHPGPVVFVNEESGKAALWRRLDALCRGRAQDPEELRERLFVAANARVKLDDSGWQDELLAVGLDLRPRLIVFDPLARMKAPGREENDQAAMAVVIEYLRRLRDETGAAVLFVHHVGHAGGHMRGSSDLESVWETRLTWTREGQSPLVTISAEHREAEAADPLTYRIDWDGLTRSMRLDLLEPDSASVPTTAERILGHVAKHPGKKGDEIARGLGLRDVDTRGVLRDLVAAGDLETGRSGRTDKLGRKIHDTVYTLAGGSSHTLLQATLGTTHGTNHDAPSQPRTDQDDPPPQTLINTRTVARPDNGTNQDEASAGHRGSVERPPSLEGDAPDEPPDEPPDDDTVHALPALVPAALSFAGSSSLELDARGRDAEPEEA